MDTLNLEEGKDGSTLLRIRVQPGAARRAIRLFPGGGVRLAVTEKPKDGEANAAVVAYLARLLGAPKRNIAVVRGLKSRDKTVSITDLRPDEVETRLRAEADR
ncbi:MAG: DUF167 domain-containing protein [Candidatus Hydrogenedentota bacterium]